MTQSTPTGLFLTYANADPGLFNALQLTVRVNGGNPQQVLMDTGSTGIVISKNCVGGNPQPLPDPPPNPSYSSSGNSYTGQWVLATVEVLSPDGNSFVTPQPIAVFAADQDVFMMGVGVRPEHPSAGFNPFTSLPQMANGQFRRGYILTSTGVQFGYGQADVATFTTFPFDVTAQPPKPLATVTLTPDPSLNLQPYSNTAPFLFDTGISYMIVTPVLGNLPETGYQQQVQTPKGQTQAFKPGVTVAVSIGGQAVWSFDTSECPVYSAAGVPNASVPEYARFAQPSAQGILNTGRHLLQVYDYLIDLDSNLLGLRRRLAAS